MNPTEEMIDAAAAVLEEEGLGYVAARRAARRVLAIPPPPPRLLKVVNIAEVERESPSVPLAPEPGMRHG